MAAASKSTFYRMTETPWYFHHPWSTPKMTATLHLCVRWITTRPSHVSHRNSSGGTPSSCSSTQDDSYDAYAIPSGTPEWQTDMNIRGCGGVYRGSTWSVLSGIHVQDSKHFGAYQGNGDGLRAESPALYQLESVGSSNWRQNGYVLLSW